jgi:hypothetical protein
MRIETGKFAFAAGLLGALVSVAPATATTLTAASAITANLPATVSPAAVSNSAVITVTDFDVAGIFSIDPFGDPDNEVYMISLAPNAHVIGIGWNVELFADSPSFLSEMVVAYGTTSTSALVFLTPGIGDDFPGTEFYSSGGVEDLVWLGLDFFVDADGILRLEFFEDFDDYPDDWDGIWESGALSIEWSVPGGPVIPEPGTWAMMIAGFGLVGLAARRRRAIAAA